MKIDYTLRCYQPEIRSPEEDPEPAEAFWPKRAPKLGRDGPTTWQQVLTLDRTPPDSSALAPPPQLSSQIRDSTVHRQMWQRILGRNNEKLTTISPDIRQMLALLHQYQQSEAMLFAHGLLQESL
jgi:hypothetical protein